VTTVSLQSLNAADKAGFIAALGDIYEHAPWVAEAVVGKRPFATLAALHEAMMAAVRAAPAEQRTALLKGHPDLAGKAARAGTMTDDSKAEQASAGLDRLSEAEYAAFHRHNDAYRSKFGIPFIVCARRHSKDSILRQFEHRLRNSVPAETKTALGEVFRIVALRLDQRVEAADKLKVNGRLSTGACRPTCSIPKPGIPQPA
jgi:2-oxo-4-hydroxy-4-carboxy-5-ureidoimidazoline decarboxylase